jgi:osmotically-inducible protein OsmY
VYYWRTQPPAERAPLRPESLGQVGQTLRDTALAGQVKAALELDRTLKSLPIEIDVASGVVTLEGRVGDEAQKSRAQAVAGAVPDVREVVNRLEVDPEAAAQAEPRRTLGESLDDTKLEVQLRLAFSLRRELSGTDVAVSSFRREVTLSGEVATEAQRGLAVEVAMHTDGVASVVDQIRVRGVESAPAPSAADRRASVEQALAANPNLARYLLTVETKDGLVVLKGRVRSGAERDLAGLLARDAAGGAVENAITVAP